MIVISLSALLFSWSLHLANFAPRSAAVEGAAELAQEFSNADFQEVSVGEFRVYVSDRVSDCVTLGHMFSTSEIPFGSRPQFSSDEAEVSQCRNLASALRTSEEFSSTSYVRFWHGSSAFFLIGAQLFSLPALVIGIGSLAIVLALLLAYRLFTLNAKLAVPIVITVFLGTDFLFAGFSYSQGLSVAIMMLALVILVFSKYLPPSKIAIISSVSGLLYAFFAQLFYPIAFALLFQMVVGTTRTQQPREPAGWTAFGSFSSGVLAFGFWIIGYGFGMVSRFADVAIRADLAVAIADFQSGAENKASFQLEPMFRAIYHHLLGSLPQFTLRWLAIMLLMLTLGYFIARLDLVVLRAIFPFVTASLITVFLWLLVFSGHNIHHWVANLTIMIVGFLVWTVAFSSNSNAALDRTESGITSSGISFRKLLKLGPTSPSL